MCSPESHPFVRGVRSRRSSGFGRSFASMGNRSVASPRWFLTIVRNHKSRDVRPEPDDCSGQERRGLHFHVLMGTIRRRVLHRWREERVSEPHSKPAPTAAPQRVIRSRGEIHAVPCSPRIIVRDRGAALDVKQSAIAGKADAAGK